MVEGDSDRAFASKAVHSGTKHVDGAVNTPIFQSTTYKLTPERYEGWAAGAQHTLLYARLSTINSDAAIKKICSLEGAEDGLLFASGMAAISTTLLGLLSAGDHIIAAPDVYGGTYGLLTEELPRFGIDVTFADMTDPTSYEAAITESTKILYIETLSNPVLKVADIPAFAEIARRHDLLLIIDNTFATPWATRPLEMGCDLVIHSTTRYLGGHSDVVGGAVVGCKELISSLFLKKVHFGGCPDPHASYLLERGMRTLHARMPIHATNARIIAERLNSHAKVLSVNHPSMMGDSQNELAQKIMPKGTGMLAFTVAGGDDFALRFLARLTLVFEATSLGGVESLVECPSNTSHIFVPEEVRIAAGINPGFIRMSVGIEDVDDLWADISQALDAP